MYERRRGPEEHVDRDCQYHKSYKEDERIPPFPVTNQHGEEKYADRVNESNRADSNMMRPGAGISDTSFFHWLDLGEKTHHKDEAQIDEIFLVRRRSDHFGFISSVSNCKTTGRFFLSV